jgi:hypothetical protein
MDVRKTALTAYGKLGTDWIRMTAARIIDSGAYVFVRADGSNSIVPVLPDTFRTSGDIANVTATLGHRVSMAAVPGVALPNHTWKGTYTLEEIASKFGFTQVEELRASYVDELEAAA